MELHHRDGSLARVLTAPEVNYRRLLGVDETAGAAMVAAGEDPTQTHIYLVALDKDAPPERLTNEPGIQSAIVSDESGVSVRSAQSLTSDLKQVVHRRDGRAVGELVSVSEKPGLQPAVELVAIGSEPTLRAALVRPRDFKRGTRYPVIVSVYGGPTLQMVTATRSRYRLDGWLANQGFIVVSIDGHGTPARDAPGSGRSRATSSNSRWPIRFAVSSRWQRSTRSSIWPGSAFSAGHSAVISRQWR